MFALIKGRCMSVDDVISLCEIPAGGSAADLFAYQMLSRAAAQSGARLDLEPASGAAARLTFPDGRVRFIRCDNHDVNGSGSADTARDKRASGYFLALAGLPVLPSCTVTRSEQVLAPGPLPEKVAAFIAAHGWPLVVKPNSLCGGDGVGRADGEPALRAALTQALSLDGTALIQPFITGHDLRVVVFDGEAHMAYVRIPPAVTGDGIHTVQSLLDEHYAGAACTPLRPATRKPDRAEVVRRLAGREGGLNRIPAVGERVPLVDTANVATGAEVVDVTGSVPKDVIELAARTSEAAGLRLAGVDLMVGDSLRSVVPGLPALPTSFSSPVTRIADSIILEVNSAPGLSGYASIGQAQEAAVEKLYARILQEVIA